MKKFITVVSASLLIPFFSYCQIRLPRLINDGMVLQRDKPVKVWGWAPAGEAVSLAFNQNNYTTKADSAGHWTIQLPAQKAGGSYEMNFTASNQITVRNILFGDVWICGGQSNMELTMERMQDRYPNETAQAHDTAIRQFIVPDRYNFSNPEDDLLSGTWQTAVPENIMSFSAAAYFFAKEIREKYHVPVGLINAALGGSPAESWLSEDAIKQFPTYYSEAKIYRDRELTAGIEYQDSKISSQWYALLNQKDEGLQQHWKDPAFNDADWKQMSVPGYWADTSLGKVNGAVWFRKNFTLPAGAAGQPARLLLGRMVDADSVFVNGIFAGTTTYQYPPRRYLLPANLLKEGTNSIVIRIVNNTGKGGFVPDKPYELVVANKTYDLKGLWQYKLGAKMEPLPGQTFIRWKPMGLYNAMIAPLLNYAIKGVIWYQGEANTSHPEVYTNVFSAVITDWRKQWKQGDFPFLYVQLANFMETKKDPSESNWASLRQAQTRTLTVPNTGMAVAIDLGEWNDIHPTNKKDVGHRLALQARSLAYGEKKVVASGPLYASMEIKDKKAILHFTNTGSGLVAKGDKELHYFAIAGKNKKFVWAKAVIKENTVEVWSDAVTAPKYVRYAWADNPEGANLYNKEGLPASPFSTE